MKLTPVQRWLLVNQHRILAALYPEEAKDHQLRAHALELGYEAAFEWQSHLCKDVLSIAECNEVHNILNMFRALRVSYDRLADKSGIERRRVEFAGFNANSDKQFGYCQFFKEAGRWPDLDLERSNFDFGLILTYRSMLEKWRLSANPMYLTK
jgi:uncharacterized protein YfbU (UPF0304 family)